MNKDAVKYIIDKLVDSGLNYTIYASGHRNLGLNGNEEIKFRSYYSDKDFVEECYLVDACDDFVVIHKTTSRGCGVHKKTYEFDAYIPYTHILRIEASYQ